MPLYDLNQSPLLFEKSPNQRRFSPLGHLLIFFAVFYASNILQTVILLLFVALSSVDSVIEMSGSLLAGDADGYMATITELFSSRQYLLASLVSTAATILAIVLFVKLVERRRLASIGLRRKYAVRHYLLGLLFGLLLFAGAAGICTLNGAITFIPSKTVSVPWLIAFLLGFAVQGASEELLLRGYFMMSFTENRKSPVFAIGISALLFAFLHSENAGFGILPFVNITLFGIIASVLMLRTNSILPSLALHTAWNFAEGCIFGTSVSGMSAMPTLLSGIIDEGKSLTNGGAFGPEGGIAVTAVLIVALMIVVFIPSNQKQKISAETPSSPVV